MLALSRDDYVDYDFYESQLNRTGYIYFDRDKANSVMLYNNIKEFSLEIGAIRRMKIMSQGQINFISDERVYTYLLDYENCPAHKLADRKNNRGWSIAITKLEPLYKEGYAQEFLEHYIEYKSMKSKCSKIKNIVTDATTPVAKSNMGSDLYALSFTAGMQRNARYYYKDRDIIGGIPKDYCNCISAKEGEVLIWGDLDQADLGGVYNLLLWTAETASIMDSCTDRYEGVGRILSKEFNEEFDLEHFKESRDAYKAYTLAPIYGSGGSPDAEGDKHIARMNRYLSKCPKYVEYKKRVEDACKLGKPLLVEGYFGHQETIIVEQSRIDDTVKKAMNYPIQTTTGELIILMATKILEKFYSIGYTEDDISLYLSRHDELCFRAKKHVLEDAWIFEDCSKVYVDNWSAMTMGFKYGYSYTEEDKELTKFVENVNKLNSDKITLLERNEQVVCSDYFPIEETLVVYFAYASIGDTGETVLVFYNEQTCTATYSKLPSVDTDDMINNMVMTCSNLAEQIREQGYSGVCIENRLAQTENYKDRVFFNFKLDKGNNPSLRKAAYLAIDMAEKICRKYGYSYDRLESLNNNRYWIKEIKSGEFYKK